jgi:polar amino acid transport system substrate-binding protein
MIQIRLLCYLFFLTLSLSSYGAKLNIQHTYRACGHPAYPPISWVSNHTVIGVGPYLVKKVMAHFDVNISFHQEANWERCLRELEKGNIDIAVALYKTKYRERYYEFFSPPIVKEDIMLFYNTQFPQQFDSFDDLKNKTMGILFGDSYGDQVDEWINQNAKVEYVSTGIQNFGKLVRGRIDIMPLGRYGGTLQSKKLGYTDLIEALDKPLATDYWYMAISKKSSLIEHMEAFNQEWVKVKNSIDIGELMATYSHQYISQPQGRD